MSPSVKSPVSGPTEFEIIQHYFAPLASSVALGLKDDAACFTAPAGQDLIVSKDMLVSERHFFAEDAPEDIAYKALSVNVSDLAAKGATPHHYLLGLSLPKAYAQHRWLAGFAKGLAEAQERYGIKLVGGDTVSIDGPLCISITAIGYVAEGTMIKRSGAQPGNDIYVSGTLGDAALGLLAIKTGRGHSDRFIQRYHRPQAQLELGQRLVGIATAAADVSDGLLADVGHVCAASAVGARLLQSKVPLSDDAAAEIVNDAALWPLILSGGDDYELVFTTDQSDGNMVAKLSQDLNIQVTKIGSIIPSTAMELVDSTGKLVQVAAKGFEHF